VATAAASRAGPSAAIAVLRLGRGTDGPRVPSPVLRDGEDLDVATVAVASDSPTSAFLLADVVAGFVRLSRQKIVVHILMDYAPLADSAE
jgi:hypothetical protein